MKATITARAQAGTAVVLSSHLLHLVEELCTRLLVVRGGRAAAYGSAEDIVAERPELAGMSLEEMFVTLTTADGVIDTA
jgi:ABC-2 type transport system ATP-binding protein